MTVHSQVFEGINSYASKGFRVSIITRWNSDFYDEFLLFFLFLLLVRPFLVYFPYPSNSLINTAVLDSFPIVILSYLDNSTPLTCFTPLSENMKENFENMDFYFVFDEVCFLKIAFTLLVINDIGNYLLQLRDQKEPGQ